MKSAISECIYVVVFVDDVAPELASLLTDIIFRTVAIYDDRGSRKAVDDVIVKALSGTVFMKTFAAVLVQSMEKQMKSQSHVGCFRLISWSCLLLSKSKFSTVSKNALCRVAAGQASLLNIVWRRSFRERRACKKKIFHLFSKVLFNLRMLMLLWSFWSMLKEIIII